MPRQIFYPVTRKDWYSSTRLCYNRAMNQVLIFAAPDGSPVSPSDLTDKASATDRFVAWTCADGQWYLLGTRPDRETCVALVESFRGWAMVHAIMNLKRVEEVTHLVALVKNARVQDTLQPTQMEVGGEIRGRN